MRETTPIIAGAIVKMARTLITVRGRIGGWEAINKGVCKTFGCNYGAWESTDETGAPEVITFNIEYGLYMDCDGTSRTLCSGDCDETDTVNVNVGWTGLSIDEADEIMEYINEHLIDKLHPEFFGRWRSKSN